MTIWILTRNWDDHELIDNLVCWWSTKPTESVLAELFPQDMAEQLFQNGHYQSEHSDKSWYHLTKLSEGELL